MSAGAERRQAGAPAPQRRRSTSKKGAARDCRAGGERLPARRLLRLDLRWLQVLVLEGRSAAYIARALENACLPPVSNDDLAAVQNGLRPPSPFDPRSPPDELFLAYADKLGLGPAFRGKPEWLRARKILNTSRAREFVEAALICAVPPDVLAKHIRACLHYDIPGDAIRLYESMFFDVSRFGRSQLRVLVQARARLAVQQATCGGEDQNAAADALEADARSFAVTLPSHSLAWAAVMPRLGFSPAKPKLAKLVDSVVDAAALRLASLALRSGAGDAEIADRLASVVQKMSRVGAGIATPVEDLHASLGKFTTRHDTTPIPYIHDLVAEGEHFTVDTGPPAAGASDGANGVETGRDPVEGDDVPDDEADKAEADV